MPSMKGLMSFIADIRYCASKEAEERRVEKELAKIRAKFSSGNAASLSGYDKKKYVWKLLYCYMLGYQIDFGHIMAVNLCSRPKYSEKNAGYLACSLLLMENHEILRLIVNIAKQDIQNENDHIVALALNTVANIGGQEFTENLFQDIEKLLLPTSTSSAYVQRKACVCLLRLFRKDAESIVASVWTKRLSTILTESTDIGLLLSCAGLIIGILEQGEQSITEWVPLVSATVRCLTNVVQENKPSHVYYTIPAPWLQIKLLRILQFFPPSEYDGQSLRQCNDLLSRQLDRQTSTVTQTHTGKKRSKADAEKLNKANVEHSVLFEAMNLIVHLDVMCDVDNLRTATDLLGGFVSSKEANIRYLGLETMARLAHGESFKKGHTENNLERYKNLILSQLQEADISIRRQALNLLYAICDPGNWQLIVDELLEVLSRNDQSLQEELVLKIAILSERNAPDFTWYIDVVFKMLEYAPANVEEDVWYRVVQVVTGFEDRKTPDHQALQKYAADKAYTMLKEVDHPHETMIKLCGYLLGEFGHVLDMSAAKLFSVLHKHFLSALCKPILLSAYAKLLNSNPDLRSKILPVFEDFNDNIDTETQQRCCEYIKLEATSAGEQVLAMMPPFPDRDNPLIRRLKPQKSRAATRQQLEEAAKSEGGIYKVGSQPAGPRSLFDTPLDDDAHPIQKPKPVSEQRKKPQKKSETSSSSQESESESSSSESEPEVTKPPKQLWSELCVQTQGPLYQSPNLNIQLKHEYQGSRGRLAIQLSNKSDSTISDLQVNIPNTDALRMQVSSAPTSLTAKQAGFQYLQVDCLAPFLQPAKYHIKFTIDGRNQQLPLTLPIILSKFFMPALLTEVQMQQYFTSLQAEQQITSQMRIAATQWPAVLRALGLHSIVAGSTTFAATTFHTAEQQIAVILKLEQAGNQGRITVRSTVAAVSQTLAQIAATYILLPPK
eukprot:GEMP01002524.1.p1 GENE.GEMP01002524.1~~GEMP01002524.1.p1  ORF type:complete len:950 (+),score=180.35 GEMP01002524.1:203-3052(+)